MMKQNNFSQQTHFIGVLLPEDITLTLEDCRRYMREAYGCKSGHGTPIHVTLVLPFRLQEEFSTDDLVRAIEKEVLPKGLGFTAHIDNFDAFGDRTLFANVVAGDEWTRLRDETVKAVTYTVSFCKSCVLNIKNSFITLNNTIFRCFYIQIFQINSFCFHLFAKIYNIRFYFFRKKQSFCS